jgi:hypothetical protein
MGICRNVEETTEYLAAGILMDEDLAVTAVVEEEEEDAADILWVEAVEEEEDFEDQCEKHTKNE